MSTRELTKKGQTTEETARLLAASELVRRGYAVALGYGVHPSSGDMAVVRPDGSKAWISVIGPKTVSSWLVAPKSAKIQFYILVDVARVASEGGRNRPDEFFILSARGAEQFKTSLKSLRPRGPRYRPENVFAAAGRFRDAWDKLEAPHVLGWEAGIYAALGVQLA